MNELYKRLEEYGRIVLMVPKNQLTTDEKNGLRNNPGLLVGSTHDHFLVSTEESDIDSADAAPLPPTKPTDPDSPEALLNPSNPEGQYRRAQDEPVSEPELDAMTVAQLKEYAAKHEVDLSGCKTKSDMMGRIREKEANAHDPEADEKSDDPTTSSHEANERRLEGEQV